jgi:hypothetical protein
MQTELSEAVLGPRHPDQLDDIDRLKIVAIGVLAPFGGVALLASPFVWESLRRALGW